MSVIGARGYSGLELCRLLLRHPRVKLTHAFATQAFSLSEELFPDSAAKVQCLAESEVMDNLTDVVFLATPAEVSFKLAPQILAAGKKVIDLSGAFRLRKTDPTPWYGFAPSKELLAQADYGLVPIAKPVSSGPKLVANPGCYATAIALALIPLIQERLIDADSLVIDAKSGTTGAGRKASENMLFSEVADDCLPYRVGRHQHLPEIQEAVEAATGVLVQPHLVTHLLPVPRGITAAIFAKPLVSEVSAVAAAFDKHYGDYKLLRHGPQVSKLASLRRVVGGPNIHISYELVETRDVVGSVSHKLYVFSVIDNLMKGAASQAVENLNRILDLPVHFSLGTSEE